MNNPQRTESESDRLWRIVIHDYKCLKRDGQLNEEDLHNVVDPLSRNVSGIPEDIRDQLEQAEDDVLVWLARLGMRSGVAASYVCLVTDKVLCERLFNGEIPGDIPKEDPIWKDELPDPYDGEPCRLFAETYEDYNSRQHDHDDFPMTDRQLFAELPKCLQPIEKENDELIAKFEKAEKEAKEEKEKKEGEKPATESEKLAAEVEREWPANG